MVAWPRRAWHRGILAWSGMVSWHGMAWHRGVLVRSRRGGILWASVHRTERAETQNRKGRGVVLSAAIRRFVFQAPFRWSFVLVRLGPAAAAGALQRL